ncbi:MAG: TrkA family potassium uptake protein [Mesorhizobium sp.]|nr:TrkA family potassium uptake protein [Mesorhizobium sp. M5C.F.Cr.IN.023.01.1.1]RWF83849.1 MAG: TrkA family potassium uptake protein [Mesorhizobium sp.]RWF95526.1 MAG: TrkA family potassium uptake protein [Mesorhizobium sp.]RWI40226.1 MAG: TrkA family potassium uptake protein [Mesorhizobium sp.]RWI45808.1 MAG: TrkA family potassium uptake protein [Mesorhizobium sp.]
MNHSAIQRSAQSLAKSRTPHGDGVVVIGLGRFGGAVAQSLVSLGHDVLAIDESAELVQSWASQLTHVVEADSSNADVLRRLGVQDFRHVVVGIGTDIEASVLTVLALAELGVPDIWAKAVNTNHGRILERTGAHHVVYPEAAMGERVAHLVTGKMIDFIEFDDGFAIVKTRTPREAVGKTLAESGVRSKYGVTVVGVKRPRTDFTYATPETVIELGDLLIVSGPTKLVEKFAAIA